MLSSMYSTFNIYLLRAHYEPDAVPSIRNTSMDKTGTAPAPTRQLVAQSHGNKAKIQWKHSNCRGAWSGGANVTFQAGSSQRSNDLECELLEGTHSAKPDLQPVFSEGWSIQRCVHVQLLRSKRAHSMTHSAKLPLSLLPFPEPSWNSEQPAGPCRALRAGLEKRMDGSKPLSNSLPECSRVATPDHVRERTFLFLSFSLF